MHHFFFIAFSLLAVTGQHVSAQSSTNRAYRSILTVTNGGQWGSWRIVSMCPSGTYAAGFSLRVERHVGLSDDTALNAIRLHCADRSKGVITLNDITPIESDIGYWGEWTRIQYCPFGYLTAFQMRVESPQGKLRDDTAANNIKFSCSDGSMLEGEGRSWGGWGDWSQTCAGRGICGISTKIEEQQGRRDDTALNDAQMYCCN